MHRITALFLRLFQEAAEGLVCDPDAGLHGNVRADRTSLLHFFPLRRVPLPAGHLCGRVDLAGRQVGMGSQQGVCKRTDIPLFPFDEAPVHLLLRIQLVEFLRGEVPHQLLQDLDRLPAADRIFCLQPVQPLSPHFHDGLFLPEILRDGIFRPIRCFLRLIPAPVGGGMEVV